MIYLFFACVIFSLFLMILLVNGEKIMKWYTQQDMPYGKDPIVIKTIDKQIFVGNHQHIHNSSLKHKFKNEEQWVLTTNQNKN